jgi:hypothetical protein
MIFISLGSVIPPEFLANSVGSYFFLGLATGFLTFEAALRPWPIARDRPGFSIVLGTWVACLLGIGGALDGGKIAWTVSGLLIGGLTVCARWRWIGAASSSPGCENSRKAFVLPSVPLLAGIAAGFACAAWAGKMATARPVLQDVSRFHDAISPATYYYPTAHQCLHWVRSVARRDKVLVIIGGHSVMHGIGQNSGEEWHRELQRLLGDDYVVVNLAMGGANPPSFAGIIYRMMAGEHPRVILVAGTGPWGFNGPEGDPPYTYLTWDAYHKGLLDSDPGYRSELRKRAKRLGPTEEILDGWIDGTLHYHDLWTSAGYEFMFTVWSDGTAGRTVRPRRLFQEPKLDFQPWAIPPDAGPKEVGIADLAAIADRELEEQPDGSIIERSTRTGAIRAMYEEAFDPRLRKGMVVCLCRLNPILKLYMTPRQIQKHEALWTVVERNIREAGITTAQVLRECTSQDYVDAAHLLSAGGRKLAREVAPLVTERARALTDPRNARESRR